MKHMPSVLAIPLIISLIPPIMTNKLSFTFRTRDDFLNNIPKDKVGIYVIWQKGQLEGLYGRTNNLRTRILGSYIPPLYTRNRKRGRPIEVMNDRPLRWGLRANVHFWEFSDNEKVIQLEHLIKRKIKKTKMVIKNEEKRQLELYNISDREQIENLISKCIAEASFL